MRLKQLKLAGFKSFVDPVVVHFPSQLVSVVGPNGCGKSNIIDAVRWVMGESSARNLRGESMSDVIFNGSSQRKPVGQASVELIFENHLGKLTGPFASYGEISIKRVVTRDGDSTYYLNGSRCRRKDVTDIFLGTGAGAKGYSIIGQGTISRIIEAKPEELRMFLEEAAGVSKYKERRRETLQRIEQTREHLDRVCDIRIELDKQLQRLDRQAKAAQRYLNLKEEERVCRAQILALKWKEYTEEQQSKQREIQELDLQYEQEQSFLAAMNKEYELLKEKSNEVQDYSQQVQESFYQVKTEMARLEEAIQQKEREKKRLEQDKQRLEEDCQHIETLLNEIKEKQLNCQQEAQSLEKKLDESRIDYKEKELKWLELKNQAAQKEVYGNELQETTNRIKSELQLKQLNEQHVKQRQQQIQIRLEQLSHNHSSLSLIDLQNKKTELEAKQNELAEIQKSDEELLKDSQCSLVKLREQLETLEHQLDQIQDEYHQYNSDYAALLAIQKSVKQANKTTETHELDNKSRLMELLKIEPEWQFACEIILNDSLCAYVLNDLDEMWAQWKEGHPIENAVTMKQAEINKNSLPRLLDKIQGDVPVTAQYLDSIYIAEELEQAISRLPELLSYESIITKSGYWLGNGWIKRPALQHDEEIGVLARQQKIMELNSVVQELNLRMETLKGQRDEYRNQVQNQITVINELQSNLNSSKEAFLANISALKINEQEMQNTQKMIQSISLETEELKHLLEELVSEELVHRNRVIELEGQLESAQREEELYIQEKRGISELLHDLNKQVDNSRRLVHQFELEFDREVNKLSQMNDTAFKEQERLSILSTRLEQINTLYIQSLEPEELLQKQLAEYLIKHSESERQLVAVRESLNQLKEQVGASERDILSKELVIKQTSELINQTRMQEQALAVRASSVLESFEELNLQVQTVLEHINEEVTQSSREADLLKISSKINQLGAINLAAIEEFTTEQQRKNYLDEQYEDLNQALDTLHAAIEKMDKETQMRLENTFEEVNTFFKALFPRLFGGGNAHLELTCDNLLEAGIVVMAQPPGKRNNTIHLLSGGEKALTAVALVFAIFQLNPSPFCMLDEVDAPLDDVNVGRFCNLVKEMSQFVQFLFITHNKITMELADHLIGVTMREPGVSRLVAVDVKQALTME